MVDSREDVVQGIEWFRTFVSRRRWQVGKADPSHEYTIRNWLPSEVEDFEIAVEIIRRFGEPAKFESRTYVYLLVDTMKYWSMGAPVAETTVLNRAKG